MKKGFSLGETLITMLIIGIISTMTIPLLTQGLATQNKSAYKAAYANLEAFTDEIIDDTALYPTGEFTDATALCNNFFEKINTIGTNSCAATAVIPDTPNIVAINGMKWYFMSDVTYSGDFTQACPDSGGNICNLIFVDINGGKGKNTETGEEAQRDILRIYVSKTGRVFAPNTGDGPERSYL